MSYINDGGHGGKDPGACANGITEKVYTLEAALYVDKRLKDHGIISGLTRDTDVALDPNPRTSKVKASKRKYCLSHHYNAGGGAGAEFIHSIFSNGAFEKLLTEEFKKAGYPVRRTFTRKGSDGRDYYFMHRQTGAVETTIIEYDFVDGPNANKLKNKAYREGMYECVVKAVCRREGKVYKPVNQPKEQPKPAPKPAAPKQQEKELHRVQVGAFTDKKNAEKLAAELQKKGYSVIIK